MNNLFTIGYSSFEISEFVKTLQQNKINAVADVRSSPYSKFKPDFNRETLKEELKKKNIEYVFLGENCGARINDPSCYIDGKASYDLIKETEQFKKGLNRILQGLDKYTIALLCAEKDPITCHRNILVCRNLKRFNIDIYHILSPDEIEKNSQSEERLLKLFSLEQNELFLGKEDLLEEAYNRQGELIAYTERGGAQDD
jgi:uncharacterized protein (DUF488 family)